MGRVLVAEDDPDIRWLVGEALEGAGYRVLAAGDGREALRLAIRDRPCLILLDLRMPIMDGRAFARAYRQTAGGGAPIICMTAETDAPLFSAEIGAVAALSKPFDLDEVIRLARRFCPNHARLGVGPPASCTSPLANPPGSRPLGQHRWAG